MMVTALHEELSALDHGSHLCLVYDTPAEQVRAAVPFITGGLERGECCVYIVDEHTAVELRDVLAAAGIDVAREMMRGALVIASQRETYLREGAFDPHAMVEFLRAIETDAITRGFAGLRVTGEMTWALGSDTDPRHLIEYETLLNEYFPGSRALAICQYNRRRFAPEIVQDVLRTHPVAILGEQVCPNLYYEPPEMVRGRRSPAERVDWMITQLQRARAAEEVLQASNRVLAEANRAKAQFLAVMSHELRTPLNAIIGYEELLRTGITGPVSDAQCAQLERIRASATHLRNLIDEILTLSRLDAGRDRVDAERVDVAAALEDAAAFTAPLAAGKRLDVRVQAPRTPLAVQTDPGKLRQVLLNLLSNAVKFTAEGEIVISARQDGDTVVVEVRDTGIGVAAEHHERIFEPFWQVEQGATRTAGGTGLGLYVSRRLARLLGGDIAVRSTPGAGAAFTLWLPAAPQPA